MKLCLLIATAVAIATCYALPVPKEEVFAVYPVNSALAQHSSDLPVETKPEEVNLPKAEGSATEVVAEEKKVEATESKQEQLKTVPETSTSDEVPKEVSPAGAKSAPLKESTTVKADEALPVTVPSTENVPTTVANNDEARLEVTQSVVAAEPKVAVPETLAEEPKLMEKKAAEKVANEEAKDEPKTKAVESVQVEAKKEESVEVSKQEETKSVKPVVETVAEEKTEKLTEESKPVVSSESAQARSSTSDALPVEQPKTDVKPEETVTDQVVVKVVVEPVAEENKPVVEQVQEMSVSTSEDAKPALSTVNVPEPQTEGTEEAKPTKVRAAPIVEGLKVSQSVEAEPAVTKIHVTVIQEEVELAGKSAVQMEAVQTDAPVTEATEDKSSEVTTTTTPEKEVKSAELAVEKASETKAEMNNDKPSEVKSVEPTVETKPAAAATVEASKEESSARAATTETVVVVVPSVKSEDVTTVIAVAESTDKPTEKDVEAETKATVEDKPAPEVEPATTVKTEDQQAKAVDGSSQPGESKSSATAQEDAKDQSDSVSTTVSSVTELDTTTVTLPVTTTVDPEPVPTPAKQKAKKQVPPNLKGYSKRLKLQEAQRKQSSDSE
ncbi:protein bangles and beads-like [Anopheles stephensi]|nr:protein bangles and beads-like [Anopheles stephensi]XP_035917331.1 protein bangles and beads-like [Anopheles stephensi]XP_035917332.1 protein bangles and beads-like [Anopheles stephensi]